MKVVQRLNGDIEVEQNESGFYMATLDKRNNIIKNIETLTSDETAVFQKHVDDIIRSQSSRDVKYLSSKRDGRDSSRD